jgi:hypothetical protein
VEGEADAIGSLEATSGLLPDVAEVGVLLEGESTCPGYIARPPWEPRRRFNGAAALQRRKFGEY